MTRYQLYRSYTSEEKSQANILRALEAINHCQGAGSRLTCGESRKLCQLSRHYIGATLALFQNIAVGIYGKIWVNC